MIEFYKHPKISFLGANCIKELNLNEFENGIF